MDFNKARVINQNTYDLYDLESSVCVQITSNSRKDKRDRAIAQFQKLYNGHKFNKLIIIFISDKKPKPENTYPIDYLDYNIIEFAGEIESNCFDEKLVQIRDILKPPSLMLTSVSEFESEKELSVEEFQRCIELEKNLKKELRFSDYHEIEDLTKNPYKQFISSRFILRSYKNSEYPELAETSKWNRTFMYDFYDTGILIWPDATYGTTARIDKDDNWYIQSFEDTKKPLKEEERILDIRTICKLPYTNILHFKFGDEYYYRDFHLYCKYNGILGTPFVHREYRYGDSAGYFWNALDETKKIEKANA